MEKRPIRVLIAVVGLDGHDRDAKILTRMLRDGGMEVVYTGLHQTPEMVVAAAIEEDVNAVVLWSRSGAHGVLFPRVVAGLREAGAGDDLLIVADGLIPPEDVAALQNIGIAVAFGPGASLGAAVAFIRDNAPHP